MTLREALQTVNRTKVFKIINKKDQGNIAACDRPSMETTIASYTHVIDEFLSKKKTKPYKFPFLVRRLKDPYDGKIYTDVSMLNPDYVAPAEGLKPWGGRKGQPIPEGYYNCNADKHNKVFGCGLTPWRKIIDTEIINESGYSLEKIVAELLWEITFYGWSETQVAGTFKDLQGRLTEALEDIDNGQYVELSDLKKKKKS